MKITMDGEYQTQDGRPWRTYSVDGGGVLPVHGAVLGEDGRWHIGIRTADGRMALDGLEYPGDLIPVPKPLRMDVWVRMGCEYFNDIGNKGSFHDADRITLVKHPDGTYTVEMPE